MAKRKRTEEIEQSSDNSWTEEGNYSHDKIRGMCSCYW